MASSIRFVTVEKCKKPAMNSGEDEISQISEPQWILEDTDGVLYWRRENKPQRNSRVTFRHAVQVVEFERYPHEPEHEVNRDDRASLIGISISCLLCVLITTVLPWYLVIGS